MLKVKINGKDTRIAVLTDLVVINNVESLSITDNQIAIDDISALAGMDGKLNDLDLSGNLIFDVDALVTHKDLVSLNLSNNKITNIGALVTLTKLKDLDLRGNPIDAKKLGELRKALPNTTILFD